MLFDPAILVENPVAVLATFLTIVVGKSVVAYAIMRAFGHARHPSLTIAASLAQIGEFSFILIVLGQKLLLVPDNGRDLIVAGALLSILFNPLLFYLVDRYGAPRPEENATQEDASSEADRQDEKPSALAGHVILVGHGRVGSRISQELSRSGKVMLVIDEDQSSLDELSQKGVETWHGNAGERLLLDRINLPAASMLISAIPDPFEAGTLIEHARAANPAIRILARAHSADAVEHLRTVGADVVIVGEDELALGLIREAMGLEPQTATPAQAAPRLAPPVP
jgi:CPA2 family monovalent cation:H+ antiporter-2